MGVSLCKRGHPRVAGRCNACRLFTRRKWVNENREQHRKSKRESARRHAERTRTERKAAYANNPEPYREQSKKWRKANPEKVVEAVERHRARKLNAPGSITNAEWLAILAKWKNCCALCGKPGTKEFGGKLHKDHVIPLAKGGVNYAHNIQPAHRHCNSSKSSNIVPGSQSSLFEAEEKRIEPVLCRAKKHSKAGPGKCGECNKDRILRFRAKDPDGWNRYQREWAAEHKEESAARYQRYKDEDPEKLRVRGREATRRYRERKREEAP